MRAMWGSTSTLIVARHKLETHFSSAALQQAGEVHEDAENALSDSRYVDLTSVVSSPSIPTMQRTSTMLFRSSLSVTEGCFSGFI